MPFYLPCNLHVVAYCNGVWVTYTNDNIYLYNLVVLWKPDHQSDFHHLETLLIGRKITGFYSSVCLVLNMAVNSEDERDLNFIIIICSNGILLFFYNHNNVIFFVNMYMSHVPMYTQDTNQQLIDIFTFWWMHVSSYDRNTENLQKKI